LKDVDNGHLENEKSQDQNLVIFLATSLDRGTTDAARDAKRQQRLTTCTKEDEAQNPGLADVEGEYERRCHQPGQGTT